MSSVVLFFPKEVILVSLLVAGLIFFRFLGAFFVGIALSGIVLPLFDIAGFQAFLLLLCVIIGFFISPQLADEQPLLFIIFSLVGLSVLVINWDEILSLFSSLGDIRLKIPELRIPFPDIDWDHRLKINP